MCDFPLCLLWTSFDRYLPLKTRIIPKDLHQSWTKDLFTPTRYSPGWTVLLDAKGDRWSLDFWDHFSRMGVFKAVIGRLLHSQTVMFLLSNLTFNQANILVCISYLAAVGLLVFAVWLGLKLSPTSANSCKTVYFIYEEDSVIHKLIDK